MKVTGVTAVMSNLHHRLTAELLLGLQVDEEATKEFDPLNAQDQVAWHPSHVAQSVFTTLASVWKTPDTIFLFRSQVFG